MPWSVMSRGLALGQGLGVGVGARLFVAGVALRAASRGESVGERRYVRVMGARLSEQHALAVGTA